MRRLQSKVSYQEIIQVLKNRDTYIERQELYILLHKEKLTLWISILKTKILKWEFWKKITIIMKVMILIINIKRELY